MITASKEKISVKEFKILYPLRDYTFPTDALIDKVHFDETYMHVTLMDGRILSIPLKWIPTLSHAKAEEREKYQINQTRRLSLDHFGVYDPLYINTLFDTREFTFPCRSVYHLFPISYDSLCLGQYSHKSKS